ncbi:MAG: hypothetical protein HY924_06085 [Elusimicrobia bacterium]|nr:hypothetical protein [Elusimicrobiota bacterium]
MNALLTLLLALASPALADLSLVQIVQSQTSGGENGLFGKTWIQVSGRKMRLVSGHARKLRVGRKAVKDPVRVIEIVDLDRGVSLHVDPKARTVETAPLTDIRYEGSAGAAAQAPQAHIVSSQIEVERGRLDRDVGDLRWGHYRIGVKVRLDEGMGLERMARMEQDLWLAPLTGELQEGLLDLAAFENEYRKATGGRFSPLDYWTYQMREVASYLKVPEGEVQELLTQVREAFPDVPGYPLASSISWWKDAEPIAAEPQVPAGKPGKPGKIQRSPWPSEPGRPSRLVPVAPIYAVRAHFRPIDFSGDWRIIDGMAGSDGSGERGGLLSRARSQRLPRTRRYPEYAVFQEELRRKVTGAVDTAATKTAKVSKHIPVPFYQINTELDAFSSVEEIPAEDFLPPPDYKPVTRRRSR